VPKVSSKYKDYNCDKFADADQEYRAVDTAWLTSRCTARLSEKVLKQLIPLPEQATIP